MNDKDVAPNESFGVFLSTYLSLSIKNPLIEKHEKLQYFDKVEEIIRVNNVHLDWVRQVGMILGRISLSYQNMIRHNLMDLCDKAFAILTDEKIEKDEG